MNMFGKKMIISVLLLLSIMGEQALAAPQYSAFKIGNGKYNVNGQIIEDSGPYNVNGHVFLPIRYVAYAIGIGDNSIVWDQATETAAIKGQRLVSKSELPDANGNYEKKYEDVIVMVKVGNKEISVNGKPIEIDAASEIKNGRLMLPIRVISEAFGCEVIWREDVQVVLVGVE